MRGIAVVGLVVSLTLCAGSSSSGAEALAIHRGCPRGLIQGASFNEAIARAKRLTYGQTFNIQGQTYVTGARNIELVASMKAQDLSLIPGMRATYADMRRRCGKRTPAWAWAFNFHFIHNIVPDYGWRFIVRTTYGWYAF